MNTHRILLALLALMAWTCATATAERLSCRRISATDGLAGNTVYEMVQDDEGFVWMATNNGLSRYDGYSAVNYTQLTVGGGAHTGARVGRLYVDHAAGRLWMSTATYQFACYDLSRGQFANWRPDNVPVPQQNKLVMTSRGVALYGLKSGISLTTTNESGECATTDYTVSSGALPSDDVLTVVEDSAHNLWLPTAAGVSCISADGGGRARIVHGSPSAAVVSAATTGQATYFLTADGRVLAYDTRLRPIPQKPLSHPLSPLPSHLSPPKQVNTSFMWQGYWLLFAPDGTYAYDTATHVITKPAAWQVTGGLSQGCCQGYHFVADAKDQLWLFADDGRVTTLNLLTDGHKAANKGWKHHVCRTPDGRLYIATYGSGLYVYDPTTGTTVHHQAADADPVVTSDYLLCAITDHQGGVWIGTEKAGVCLLTTTDTDTAYYLQPQPGRRGGWENTVSSIDATTDGQYIIGTRDGSLYRLGSDGRHATLTDTMGGEIRACITDRQGRRWVATYGDGLYTGNRHYTSGQNPSAIHHIGTDLVTDIVADGQGKVYVATWNAGLLTIGEQTGDVTARRLTTGMNERRINQLCLTTDGTLWAATNNGLYRLSPDGNTEAYNTANGRLPADEVTAVCLSDERTLWAGTASSGVLKCRLTAGGRMESVSTIDTRQGLANNSVQAVTTDGGSYVWVGTEDGLSRISPQSGLVSTYRFGTTLQGNATSGCALLATADGRLLVGTGDGLLTVNTTLLDDAHRQTEGQKQALLTDLRVNGTSVYELGVLSQALSRTDRIVLKNDQNSLAFYFSNFQYDGRRQPVYQYRLEGFDPTWRDMTTQHHADYTELRPGRYTFHLRSMDSRGEWNDTTRLTVVISQPWWNTWWAWMVYIAVAAAAVAYAYANGRERLRLHQQMKMERQLSDYRAQLFTNVTHEFRTPLAIIKGAVDKLGRDSGNREALQTAQRGTGRLLRLVNQFMEFRKISTGNLRLQVEQTDIVDFVRLAVQDFWTMTKQKEQQLTFLPDAKAHTATIDRQMVETIVYNLLSNAVKYTPERGTIIVRLKTAGDKLQLSVEDSGPGIGPEQQKKLFRPFMEGYVSQGGMGIGLYTAYQMAVAHKGSLSYERRPDGSRFTLTLPATDDAYGADDYRDTAAIAHDTTYTQAGDSTTADIVRLMQGEAYNDLTVAIVEDNPDMMQQISSEVGVYFRTACYANGTDALNALTAHQHPSTTNQPPATTSPALIICDIMLPDTDGYTIVQRLKSDSRTATTPVIMLTALDDEEHQIRAYRAGADDYMVKPCNFRLLIARAIQLIKWAAKSEATIHQDPSTSEGELVVMETQADKRFKEKLEMLTAQHLADDGFTVDALAQMMNMGRTKFYGKVKELTGLSPNKYLQEARMARAAELLADGELTVAEVSYKVGIQDPSYFNKMFKAHYGVVPSKYAR